MAQQLLMTDLAKNKIKALVKSYTFKKAFNFFQFASNAFINNLGLVESFDRSKPPLELKKLISKVQNEEDVYVFRHRGHRFIFTIDKNEEGNDSIILVDIVGRKGIRTNNKLRRKGLRESSEEEVPSIRD
ncbi:hypothetical protein LC065_13440 [Halobacillus litoralis]|uniref:hypothetical protein n=1 Tax=Halobacillus litoralis TaxID=45668 RepID=UPI001CFEED74|nr:hypothetical protein [Halobacillus litoralis]WLR46571.1 hypothetical protein LC065_13440 [Halobacillus litoralis]